MTYFGSRCGSGDMQKYIYDSDADDKIDPGAMANHASKHQPAGADEIDCSGLSGRVNMIGRGEFTSHDFTLANLTTDATWRELDLSGIVPSGTKFVYIKVTLEDDAADSILILKKLGTGASNKNSVSCRTMVANISNYIIFFVGCDSNRKIEYYATNVVWTAIYINVLGWVI
jgi:hypothetical protein